MKLYYIAEITKIKENLPGVLKKINQHIELFKQNNFEVEVIDSSKHYNGLIDKVYCSLPFTACAGDWKNISCIDDNSCLYIRYNRSDNMLIKKLKYLKNNTKGLKIIVEIPTYPYSTETKIRLKSFAKHMKDKFNRNKLYKYVDKIVTYSEDEFIFNIETINIHNSLIGSSIKPKVVKEISKNREINVLAIATFEEWHGYDRFIKGLGLYYSKNYDIDIKLHLVGDGPSIKNYKKLVNEFNIEKYVKFYGFKTGKELEEIYNTIDIALDAMGRHRGGVFYNSTLKGKEYAFKGIPSISGVKTDLDKYKEFKYYFRVPADETIIDMSDVINFYKNIYENKESYAEVINNIRCFAEQNFEMNICMKEVIEYIKS